MNIQTYDGKVVGSVFVDDTGIHKVIEVGDYGEYTCESIIPRAVFVEAYNKFIGSTPEKAKLISEIKVNIDDMEVKDKLIKELQKEPRPPVISCDEPKVFNAEDFKRFVESKVDMQDLYLPEHLFMLLDEYMERYFYGGTD